MRAKAAGGLCRVEVPAPGTALSMQLVGKRWLAHAVPQSTPGLRLRAREFAQPQTHKTVVAVTYG